MQMNGLQDWISELENKAVDFVNRTESQVIAALVNFRDKRGQLNFQISKLKANPPKSSAPAALKADYAATLALANDAKAKADWVGKIADTFTNITGLGSLGVLPAVIAGVSLPVMLAAMAGIVAVVYTVTSAVSKYIGAKQISEAATAAGTSPQTALEKYYAQQKGSGIFGDASQLVWPIAIVAGAVLFLNSGKRR